VRGEADPVPARTWDGCSLNVRAIIVVCPAALLDHVSFGMHGLRVGLWLCDGGPVSEGNERLNQDLVVVPDGGGERGQMVGLLRRRC
jgi:cytochrome c biogenesis protein ResB